MDTKLEAGCDVDRVKVRYKGRHRRPFSLPPELPEGISRPLPRADAEHPEDAVQVTGKLLPFLIVTLVRPDTDVVGLLGQFDPVPDAEAPGHLGPPTYSSARPASA
jgi:hypothetical protein